MNKLWKPAALGDLAVLTIGGAWGDDPTTKGADFSEAYCIRGSEFKNWQEDKGRTASLRNIKKPSLKKRILVEGDILVEISGGGPDQPVGRTVLVDKEVLAFSPETPKVCTNFLRLLRPTNKISASYLNSFLRFFYKSGEVVKYQGGSNNLRNLRFDDYLQISIPIASSYEQKEIVSIVDEVTSDLDNAIENLKKAQEQLKIYRLAVLKYSFEGRFTRATFEEVPIEKIALSVTYGTSNKAEKSGAIPVLRMGNINNGKIDYSNLKFYRNLDDLENLLLESGDLLFNRTNSAELVGKTGIFTGYSQYKQVTFASYLIRIRVDRKKVIPAYLNYWMNSPEALLIKNKLKNQQVGQANINGTKLKSIKFPLVIDMKKQKSIVEEIESRFSVCDQLEQTIELNLQKAESLRQSILKQAFEGKLTEHWRKNHKGLISGENSAEALLKKIMVEKAVLNGKAKRIINHD